MKLLTNYDINDLCSQYNMQITGIHCRDVIPNDISGWFIINLDLQANGGTHWCSAYKNKLKSFYFDSFGFIPPNNLSKILKNYEYNDLKIQSLSSQSCGWFCLICIHYCQNNNNDFQKFIKIFSENENFK